MRMKSYYDSVSMSQGNNGMETYEGCEGRVERVINGVQEAGTQALALPAAAPAV